MSRGKVKLNTTHNRHHMERLLFLFLILLVACSGAPLLTTTEPDELPNRALRSRCPKKVKCKFTPRFCAKYGKGYFPAKTSPADCCPSACVQQFSVSSTSYNRRLALRTMARMLRSRCPKKVKCKFTPRFCAKYGKGYFPAKTSPADCCPSACVQQFSVSSTSYNRRLSGLDYY